MVMEALAFVWHLVRMPIWIRPVQCIWNILSTCFIYIGHRKQLFSSVLPCMNLTWAKKNIKIRMPSSRLGTHTVPSAAVATGGGGGEAVSQHALGKEMCIPACTGQGVCIPACTGQGVCIPACTGQAVCIPACTGQRGCLSRDVFLGVSAWGCLPQCMLGYTPPPLWREWQTPVKT